MKGKGHADKLVVRKSSGGKSRNVICVRGKNE